MQRYNEINLFWQFKYLFQVFQDIEERPIPPLFFEPKGRHTRLRWTGANEKEIPGLGRY